MSQKTDNLIKLALVFFVSLLSFSIGTYVGKKYSDNQHKLALLEPKKESTAKNTEEFVAESAAQTSEGEKAVAATTPAGSTPGAEAINGEEKPAALTDSEVAKIAEEFASEEESTEGKIVSNVEPGEKTVAKIPNQGKPVEKTQTPTKTIAAATTATPTETAPVTKATTSEKLPPKMVTSTNTVKTTLPTTTTNTPTNTEKPVVSNKPNLVPKTVVTNNPTARVPKATIPTQTENETITASPSDNENREPASIPPNTEIIPIHYTVQIGSFPTQGEAEGLTKTLQNKGYKTSFVPARVNGQVWYRVNVGLFGTIKEAQDYKKEFLEKTKLSSAIVQRLQR